jgi:hypothetical protein
MKQCFAITNIMAFEYNTEEQENVLGMVSFQ